MKEHMTPSLGGNDPSAGDVIRSANARSRAMRRTDMNVLPRSGGESLDKSGVQDEGYLTKKGTPYGVSANFNCLPPGTKIEDQELSDIRGMPLRTYSGGLSYPTDGAW